MATKGNEDNRGRPFEFPDPNDCSPNKPHTKLEKREILGLYNQAHPGEEAKNISEGVKDWLTQEATDVGFSSVNVVEGIAILGANVVLQKSDKPA